VSENRLARTKWLLAQLPAEATFLALVASGEEADEQLRKLLEGSLQWEPLVTLAARERAIAPLARRLHALGASTVPSAVMDRLDRLALVSDFQLSTLHDRLARVLTLLASRNIEAVLLKGAGLAYSAYKRPTARPMGDVDLLVPPDRAHEAWQLMTTDGWVRRSDIAPERNYDEHHHLAPLEDAQGLQMGLELHIALFTRQAPFNLPPTQIWESARPIRVGSASALVPSPEDQLLHAALHFAWTHEMMFGAWRTMRDVERLTSSGELRWDTFVAKAQAARGATCCYWTLRLARELVGATVPDAVLATLAPPLPARVLRSLMAYFAVHALPVEGTTTHSVTLSRALWKLAVSPGRQGHGTSRPWLDTEDWVRDGGRMKPAPSPSMRGFFHRGANLIRIVVQLAGF
jgi:hypothetical protein